MSKLKIFGLVNLLVLISNLVIGQSEFKIRYTKTAELLINEISIDSNITFENLIKTLGEPSRKAKNKKGEISYFYENSGVVFFTSDGAINGIGVNFNWDGDIKFPKSTFAGTLNIGEQKINKDTKSESIAAIKLIEFICPFPMMCASKDKEVRIKCTVGFKDTKLTQIVFFMN